jgi:choline dehydrogenase-like flavoprotein
MQPHSRGRVGLRDVDHNLLADQRDRDALRDGLEIARELAEHPALRRLGRAVTSSIDETLGVYFHPVGTCAHVDLPVNLHVADASVLDPIPHANTHLPTLALAERVADQLRDPR